MEGVEAGADMEAITGGVGGAVTIQKITQQQQDTEPQEIIEEEEQEIAKIKKEEMGESARGLSFNGGRDG